MFTTVSHNYYQSIIENELVSPALYKRLKELSEQGRFRGIINVLMDPLASGFTTDGLQEYYKTLDIVKDTTRYSGVFIKVCVINNVYQE